MAYQKRASQLYQVNVGGSGVLDIGATKGKFRAPKDAYDNIGPALGVTPLSDNVFAIGGSDIAKSFGRVRISYVHDAGDATRPAIVRSALRYCDSDKIEQLINNKSINDKKIKVNGVEYQINGVGRAG